MPLFRLDLPKPAAWPPPRDPTTVAEALAYARRRDPIGDWAHTILALMYLAAMPLAPALTAVTGVGLAGYAILRLPHTWRTYTVLLRDPILWILVAFVSWYALSLTWSSDPAQGRDELRAARALATPLVLWPVIHRAPWLITALLVGVIAQNGAQLANFLGWIENAKYNTPDRLGGLLHPVQTGAWCAAALCWFTAAVLNGRGRGRWLALLGAGATAAGLVATGSRGPWLAAAVALPALVITVALRRPESRRAALALAALAIVGSVAAWPLARARIVTRLQTAGAEVKAAQQDDVYWSSAGLRTAMWSWAWSAFEEHPVRGIGAGGYRNYVATHPTFLAAVELAPVKQKPKRAKYMLRDHPHSTYLHLLGCTGLIGGSLFAAAGILALGRCGRSASDHPYFDGTLFVLLTWLIGAALDCYHLNGQLVGLLGLVVALTLKHRLPVGYTVPEPHPPPGQTPETG